MVLDLQRGSNRKDGAQPPQWVAFRCQTYPEIASGGWKFVGNSNLVPTKKGLEISIKPLFINLVAGAGI